MNDDDRDDEDDDDELSPRELLDHCIFCGVYVGYELLQCYGYCPNCEPEMFNPKNEDTPRIE